MIIILHTPALFEPGESTGPKLRTFIRFFFCGVQNTRVILDQILTKMLKDIGTCHCQYFELLTLEHKRKRLSVF